MTRRKNPKTNPATAANVKGAVEGTQKVTPQYLAKTFKTCLKFIMGICDRFSCRQDDLELVRLYVTWRGLTEKWRDIAGEHVAFTPALPKVPRLIRNDYYAGMVNLADFCREAAKRLCAADVKVPAPVPAPTTVDRAADYITKHAGSDGCKTVAVCKEACDGMERNSFLSHISPALRKRGFRVGKGCAAAWYPPEKANK